MNTKSLEDLLRENELLRSKLEEAADTLEAIRTGQIDALVVTGEEGHSLYTLTSADQAYRVFIEQMAEGAVSLNSDGLITFCNTQFAKMINLPHAKVVGRLFSELVIDADEARFKEFVAEAREQNVKSEVALYADGNPVHVKISLNSLKLEGELFLNLIVTDLTHQKEAERQLKNKNEELEQVNEALLNSNHDLQQFASVASHDLQEPVRKIQVFANFLKDRSFKDLSDSAKQHVDKILISADRMRVLIVDILTYSRLSADGEVVELIDLNTLFNEIMEDFDLRIIEKKANIQLGDLCTIEGNKGQLRQVFHNLVSNALKFSSPDRPPVLTITKNNFHAKDLGLSLENESAYCRIMVKDNGIGFDENYSSSIFQLFEKLNPKTTYEGSGIGLSIAKKIIDKHHGVIIAKSKPGVGSEFNVILPLKQPEAK